MVGEIGEAIEPVHTKGRVFVHGEYWQACSDIPIPAGAEIEIVRVMDGLKLEVKTIETMSSTEKNEPEED